MTSSPVPRPASLISYFLSSCYNTPMKNKPRIAIFVSGSGTNMVNLIQSVKKRRIQAEVGLVFCDKLTAPAIGKAKKLGVRCITFSPSQFKNKNAYEREIVAVLKKLKIKYVILAGYMRIVGSVLLKAYKNRIVNIHPALLPSFSGAHGIQDAFDAGVRMTGVTVHFATDVVDGGPIILQEVVPISSKDTLKSLEKKIHRAEYRLYPKAVQLLVTGKLQIRGKKASIR